jgi:hypothetical protein
MKEKRNAYKILIGKPEKEIPHWRPMHRWEEDNITVKLFPS